MRSPIGRPEVAAGCLGLWRTEIGPQRVARRWSSWRESSRGRPLVRLPAAKLVGKLVAERAAAAGVKTVVFDRGSYLYHGRVKALADAAREGGLNF